MDKEELKGMISDFNKMIDEFNETLKNSIDEFNADVAEKHEAASDAAEIKEAETKAELEQKIKDANGDVIALKENLRDLVDKSESALNSGFLQAQMAIEEGEAQIDKALDELDNLYLEDFISDQMSYAEYCMGLAEYATEEAKLAALNAEAAKKELESRK